MSSAGEPEHAAFSPSVFLSYASEDRDAARSLRDALTAAGLDVWYDENELGGGDAWDQKIRKQIRDCVYFMPIVSARTEARKEGYFRREWRLAVDRTHDMADDVLFLLPIVIDETDQASARVPERFLSVQWLKVKDGKSTPALTALCRRLVLGKGVEPPPLRRAAPAPRVEKPIAAGPPPMPVFPHEEPGQKIRYFALVIWWALQSARALYRRLPRWGRALVILWLVFSFLAKCSTDRKHTNVSPLTSSEKQVLIDEQQSLKDTAKKYDNATGPAEIAKISAEFAQSLAKDISENSGKTTPLMVIPFSVPTDDVDGAKFANTIFVTLLGQLTLAHPDKVGISKDPLSGVDLAASAKERAKTRHSTHVLYGAIEGTGASRTLSIRIIDVSDEDNNWAKSYPVAGADPAVIATEISSHLADIDSD